MFDLMRYSRTKNGSGKVTNAHQEMVRGGDLAGNVSFHPRLLRPYTARAVRNVNGRNIPYGPERVWVDVLRGTEEMKKNGEVVRNTKGDPVIVEVYEPELVQDRGRRDLPVFNGGRVNNATILRKEQWIRMDQIVKEVQRKRLKLWARMRANNTLGGFDGMAFPILEHERVTDAGEAVVSMSPKSRGNVGQETFELEGTPLPITSADYDIDARLLAISRNRGGGDLGVRRQRLCARRVAEMIERTAIGSQTGIQYGDATDWESSTSKVYGLINHPDRITKTDMTASASISGANWLANVLALIVLAEAQNFYGPYDLYISEAYDQESRNDFKSESDKTIRQRVLELAEINMIERLDYLTGDQMILVPSDDENIEAINGMEVTTVQRATTDWEEVSFKVMGIQVPRITSVNVNTDTDGGPATATTAKAPIVHGTTA